jgi:chorismate synthase
LSGSIFGKIFQVATYGESYSSATGVVIDGCPAGLYISKYELKNFLARRKPIMFFSTKRKEQDYFEIISGVFKNTTIGTPICILVRNQDLQQSSYDELKNIFRPGHADYSYYKKFGVCDYRGGGRASGRETVARVIAGYIAQKILKEINISVFAYTLSINSIKATSKNYDQISKNHLFMPDMSAYKKAIKFLANNKLDDDSVGGIIECHIKGLIPGIGEPVFNKLDAEISKAVMSIGAVKGIEFGNGFDSSYLLGSKNNDQYFFNKHKGIIQKKTNRAGGIAGGISDGDDIIFRVAVKPTPSIRKVQSTVNKSNQNVKIKIQGRHDKLIVPRAVVVVESMASIVLVDQIMQTCCNKLECLKKIFLAARN